MTIEQHQTNALTVVINQGDLIPLTFNPDDYRHHLEGHDLTPEQEDELLKNLWEIIKYFVDMGFALDPIQLLFNQLDRDGVINDQE